jgi:hypothetical protein
MPRGMKRVLFGAMTRDEIISPSPTNRAKHQTMEQYEEES